MANLVVIQHERRGNSIKPKDDNVSTKNGTTFVPEGSSVKFTVVDAVGTNIIFEGRTPFVQFDVPYGAEVALTGKFDTSNPSRNRFVYRCFGTSLDGKTRLDSKDGGGEVEIVRT